MLFWLSIFPIIHAYKGTNSCVDGLANIRVDGLANIGVDMGHHRSL
jgi:hypothetical protein